MLEDLRLYSEVDTSDMRMKPHPARSIYAEAVLAIGGELESAGAEVELSVEGSIRADAPLLSLAIRSILENLLGSAQRQDPGGDWLVSIRSHEELFTHRVDITTRRLAQPLPPVDLSGGSTRPVSARRARRRALNDVRELGLGLSIASHIIDLHQGELQIELKSDGSNSYSVILPGHARAIEPARAAPSA
ncbi:MAG: hypothetical protein U1E02_21395 [Hydrogenophaga sp.]|nr:hypothetical protein [Hydrogenophaga sp.]